MSEKEVLPTIFSPTDGGAIEYVRTMVGAPLKSQRGPRYYIELKLKPEKCLEACGTFKQWFCLDVHNLPAHGETEFVILDAGESTFPDWNGYKVCVTADGKTWDRVDNTTFENGKLSWTIIDSAISTLTFAYFPTYSIERQESQLRTWLSSKKCTHKILGESVDGHPLHSLIFEPLESLHHVIWIQHRQHPGEVSASWFCDGVMKRLLSLSSNSLLRKNCKVIVIPNVCPDGGFRGHLRTNAVGANLNRCWGILHGLTAPGQSDPPAPEVVAMTNAMKEIGGPDLMLDIHQDEEKPYVFISKTPLGVPSCTPELRKLRENFHEVLRKNSTDFETEGPIDPVGYPEPQPGKANLNICSASVAEAFPGCLSLTMEHPYKGNDNRGPEFARGFTIEQCEKLGEDTVNAVEEIIPQLIRNHRDGDEDKGGGKRRKV
ncbi:hypothetical protein TL16_g12775 [Triparma laevis f. inornata]|uniref:Peptidase M14 domain-containing protein n=2 Tax=Triparma laevis TaxID=1534972 RepID=A0A9W7FU32_9STRA|nr:hypothetical protein TL16_g12775 [Triparma laevis f. inornata]GMI17963.1 hypothetical protein TrLO_g8027 [Triparma laevis f. longispina]